MLTASTGVGFGLALPHFSYRPLELRTVISILGGEGKRSQNLWNRQCLVLLLLCWYIFAPALVHGSGSYSALQTCFLLPCAVNSSSLLKPYIYTVVMLTVLSCDTGH